jgi:two-component system, sporulation sensor kinase B
MKAFRLMVVILLVCGIILTIFLTNPKSIHNESSEALITEWNIQWITAAEPKDQYPPSNETWHPRNISDPLTTIPVGAFGAWVHIVIPPTSHLLHPGLLIEQLYGLDITVYEDSRLVYRSTRDYDFERNILLIPVTAKPDSTDLYIHIDSKERAGLNSTVQIGEYNHLSNAFVRKELPNLLFGTSIAFLAFMMLICSGYLNRNQRNPWIALSMFALSTGTLIVTYSSFPYFYFIEYGHTLFFMFDTSMYVIFPALHYFVAQTFEGKYTFFAKFGRWLSGYYAFCFVIMIIYKLIGEPFYFYYKLFTFWILAPFILVQLLLIIILSILNAFRRNTNSIILSTGILLLALSGVADLVLFYLNDGKYLLSLWKWGIVMLIASLVMILSRRISADYLKLLSYSKELELHNHQLQKTEKLKIISELAASIAHEVRNPMQVTRGFLQLLSSKSTEENNRHFSMAIDELDRASDIITDFLTFARPELDTVVPMDLQQELNKIEVIMSPLVAINGGVLHVRVAENLNILGNPSKFKQAFINMIKNSIEALQIGGIIEIEACAEQNTVVIRISDNGEGMDEEHIAKLGEPYFSTKTKGTGLGLMVTFRIIEVMKGTLEFRSVKGKGTEAIVRFPLANQN